MTEISTSLDVLVGIDGSAQSLAALEWAVDEARHRKAGLQLAHVCEAGSYGLWTTTRTLRAGLRELMQPIVDHAVSHAQQLDPEVAVRGRLVLGSTLPSLLRLADRAQLIVVGRQGRGALRAHLPGTVTQRLMELASCPVVMVPAGTVSPVQRVVLGVGDRRPCDELLDFAATVAENHSVPLLGLHCHDSNYQALREALDRLGERHPLIDLAGKQVAGTLAEHCLPSDLLVLGRHHHPRLTPATLGAEVSAAVHHAPCPVAVVG